MLRRNDTDDLKRDDVKHLFARMLHKFVDTSLDQPDVSNQTKMPSLLFEEDNEDYENFYDKTEDQIESKSLPDIIE